MAADGLVYAFEDDKMALTANRFADRDEVGPHEQDAVVAPHKGGFARRSDRLGTESCSPHSPGHA